MVRRGDVNPRGASSVVENMKTLALVLLLAVPAVADDDGQIVRNSMGGDIDVANAPHGAVLRTMGGNITVDRARGHVSARTMGGDIRIRNVHGSVTAGTMGGNVSVEVAGASDDAEFEIHSMGGHIEVTFPAAFSGTFEVELEQDGEGPENRIVSEFPLQVRQSTRRRMFRRPVGVLTATGRTGTGDARVRISTIGSDIVIRKR
jgi:DUF4097 and DUF4098 domain-containing protein YvlB